MVRLDFHSTCTLEIVSGSDGKAGFSFHLYIDYGFSFDGDIGFSFQMLTDNGFRL